MDGDYTTYDVIVVGGGVAGLSAAVFAALGGAHVALFERSEHVGGAVAWSDGLIWAPNSRLDPQQMRRAAEGYLDGAIGAGSDKALRFAFLDAAPKVIDTLIDEALIDLRVEAGRPDYRGGIAGAVTEGRALMSMPFDGRFLENALDMIRPPLPEATVLGGMMAETHEMTGMRPATLAEARRKARLLSQYLGDRMRYGRATRLVGGQALVAHLVQAALDNEVEIFRNSPVTEVAQNPLVVKAGASYLARKAIILATGGFAADPTPRDAHIPDALAATFLTEDVTLRPERQASLHGAVSGLGAVYRQGGECPVLLAPHSQRRRADGSVVTLAHTQPLGCKPGVMLVNDLGQRFVNEALDPNALAWAQIEAGVLPAYLIADATALRRFGLGLVRPGLASVTGYLNDGYLTSAPSLDALAFTLGMDAAGLVDTAKRFERFAETGEDLEFRRGGTAFERAAGDPTHGPNPTLGALRTPPFYAVRVQPGVASTAMGFATTNTGQLIDGSGAPMPGLYAVGEDMQSPFGDVSVAPGQSLGHAISFAYLAARHAVMRQISAEVA